MNLSTFFIVCRLWISRSVKFTFFFSNKSKTAHKYTGIAVVSLGLVYAHCCSSVLLNMHSSNTSCKPWSWKIYIFLFQSKLMGNKNDFRDTTSTICVFCLVWYTWSTRAPQWGLVASVQKGMRGGAVPRVLWDCSGCVCRGLSGQIFLGCAWSGREGLPVIKPVEPKDSRQWLSHSIPIPPSLSNRTDWSVLQYCVTYLRVRVLSKVCLVPVSPYRKSEIHQSDRRPAFWSRSLKARNRDKKMSNFSVINCLFCFVIGTWLWLPLYQNKSRQMQRSPGGYQQ